MWQRWAKSRCRCGTDVHRVGVHTQAVCACAHARTHARTPTLIRPPARPHGRVSGRNGQAAAHIRRLRRSQGAATTAGTSCTLPGPRQRPRCSACPGVQWPTCRRNMSCGTHGVPRGSGACSNRRRHTWHRRAFAPGDHIRGSLRTHAHARAHTTKQKHAHGRKLTTHANARSAAHRAAPRALCLSADDPSHTHDAPSGAQGYSGVLAESHRNRERTTDSQRHSVVQGYWVLRC